MHININAQQQRPTGGTISLAKSSVGQRLKDASSLSMENPIANGFSSLIAASERQSHFAKKCPQFDQCQYSLRTHQPVVLNELQRNTIRVIGQYLRELGMHDTVDALVEESGCRIENPLSMKLRESILRGLWQKALEIVEKLKIQLTEKQYLTVRVLLLEEKFKELVFQGQYLLALRLLQIDYPKCKELRYRHENLAAQLYSQSQNRDMTGQFDTHHIDSKMSNNLSSQDENSQKKTGAQVLHVLRKVLPPSLMLPPDRLQELLKQSWLYQSKHCDLHVLSREHNILDDRAILLDHQCTSKDFPSKNTCTLYLHNAEVWCVKFSPCGRYLASGAKGNQVIIWRVESPNNVNIYQSIQIMQDIVGIACLAWSYDSRYLAVCSSDQPNGNGCFIYYVPSGRLIKEYTHYAGDSFTSVSFFKDKSHKLACAGQRGHFHIYDINRPEDNSKAFEGFRIRCLYACKDGHSVLAADTHNRIRHYNFESQREQTIIQESSQIMHFTVDREERYCLVTTKTEGIRLWCLKTFTLQKSFFGANHSEFVITSSFGGPEDAFAASGSEDHSVVVWNLRRKSGYPVKRLTGHTSTVNSVSWNPLDPTMLASCSDDGTIKIWSTTKHFG